VKRSLEALLFATDTPLTMGRLKALFPDAGAREIRAAMTELAREYDAQERAFTIVEFGGGWQLATRPEYAPLVQRLYRGKRFVRLSQAALEVLAIVAYRQPVTRMEIEEIRGVQVSGVLATLQERNLVTVVGRSDAVGNPLLYGTTREFLNHLGLKGLHQLPPLPELEGIIGDRDALRQFAAQLGEPLDDATLETVAVRGDEIVVVAEEPGADAESAEGAETAEGEETAAAADAPDGNDAAEDAPLAPAAGDAAATGGEAAPPAARETAGES